MPARRLGYKPDPDDPRDLDLRSLQLGADEELPHGFSMRMLIREVLNQGSSSSCVAQAFAQAIVTTESYRGINLPLPARRFIYANARKQHSTILTDTGTYLRCAANGLYKLGAPPESDFPFSTGLLQINRMPPFTAYMRAHGRRGGGYFRVKETDDARVTAVQRALVTGTPVVFGTLVTHAFLEDSGPTVIGCPKLSDRFAGGHAMCIVGYEVTPVGVMFEVVNSWGMNWRDGGYWRMPSEYLCWSQTTDLWVVRGWESVANV